MQRILSRLRRITTASRTLTEKSHADSLSFQGLVGRRLTRPRRLRGDRVAGQFDDPAYVCAKCSRLRAQNSVAGNH